MIDTLRAELDRARKSGALAALGLTPRSYGLVTLHRPATVDRAEILHALLEAIAAIARRLPVVFPVHPRSRGAVGRWLDRRPGGAPGLILSPPLGYLEFLELMAEARVVMTDSGGVQEETTALGVPCLTLRHNTERPVTVAEGTNTLVGQDPARLLAAVEEVLSGRGKVGRLPERWDGHAAERIAAVIRDWDRTLR
jgi:UDP-N-acetylglucosamine 2-epimerase (non-hydrolysing)